MGLAGRHAGICATVLILLLPGMAAAPVAASSPASLYSGADPRPGPDLLYRPLATAPQLTNAPGSVWQATSILVSGASAYRAGEYLYQDFLYDDRGANGTVRDQNDKRASLEAISEPDGTYTYPSGPGYNNNAADLVEFRVKPLTDATAFRITLNTLVDPTLPVFTIAIGTTSSPSAPLPHGAHGTAPASMFLTVHNTYADLIDGAGAAVGTVPRPQVDQSRRQVEARIPHTVWNPGNSSVRFSMGVGLWDRATADGPGGRYLMPQQNADATHPGGLGVLSPSTASAFFNVGFRHLEPGGANGFNPAAWWREAQQSSALQTGDLTQFHDDVDFGKLAAGVNDDMPGQPQGVPQSGPVDRILQSHFELQQGANFSQGCGGNDGCHGEYLGQLQPYNVYVPKSHTPGTRYGMTLLLHSLSVNYNQFYGSHNQSQFGDRGTGSLVLTAEGRGPDGWYVEYAGADVIEDWADVAAHYQIDPDWTAISGYSMGGYGTYRLGTLFPDLFAKGQPVVGPPGVGIWAPPAEATGGKASNTYYQLASMRNVPMLIWDAAEDQLVPTSGTETQARGFDGLGYRYEYDLFEGHGAGHFGLAVNDQYQPAADWLATTRVDRDPPHVTYVVNPKMSFPAIGIVADHAYWLSNIQLHDSSGTAPLGTIDVRSEGFGVADPAPSATMFGAGVLTGGTLGPMAYTSQAKTWGPAGAAPIADKLDISASNVSAVNVNVQRARVDCNVALNITSSTPLQVTLAGCNRAVSFTPALPNTAAGQLRTFTIRTLVIAAAALVLLLFSAALVAALLLSAAPRRP